MSEETMLQHAARVRHQELLSSTGVKVCGIAAALLPFCIGAFLMIRGAETFFVFGHSLTEFLTSGVWQPSDSIEGGGQVGAAMFISGSVVICFLALVLALPVSLAAAIYMTEIAQPSTRRKVQPLIELFTGIPSVIYGWIGLTVLIPLLRKIFPMPFGFSVLAANIVLAVMIFPVITMMASDAMMAVPNSWRDAAYGLGATRWETIRTVVIPAAKTGIFTGIVLGLARALGEALAVAMVVGQMKKFPTSLFLPATTMTTVIASDMGSAMEGGEYNAALWTLAFLLFALSFILIFIIHMVGKDKLKEA